MTDLLEGLVDRVLQHCSHDANVSFGPIPLQLSADNRPAVAEVARHLAVSEGGGWTKLQVAAVTQSSMGMVQLPQDLRPAAGKLRRSRIGDAVLHATGFEGCTWLLDRNRSIAVRWAAENSDPVNWARQNPLRTAGGWWAIENGAALVH